MVRNVECCLLFEVTNTVLELVKVQQLPRRIQRRESPNPLTEQVPSKALMAALSNHDAGFLKTAGSIGQLLALDEAISKWIKGLGVGLRGGLSCGD